MKDKTNNTVVLVPENINIDEELKKIQYLEAMERINLKKDLERQIEFSKTENIKAYKKGLQDKIKFQAECPHLLPNNAGSALVGQKMMDGQHIYVCQNCQKEWKNAEVPGHLRIASAKVGGPVL